MQRRDMRRRAGGEGAQAVRRSVPDLPIGARALVLCRAPIPRDADLPARLSQGPHVIVPKAS